MLVRSLCRHYTNQFREEGETFEHHGPLYEHIVPVDETVDETAEEPADDTVDDDTVDEAAEPTRPQGRRRKPARTS